MVWASEKGPEFDLKEMLYGHVLDGHVWHFADGQYGTLYLPVILYSRDRGWELFSSAHFFDSHHRLVSYRGYFLSKGRIGASDAGRRVWDFSLTKNVIFLLLEALLLCMMFLYAAGRYRKGSAAPRGLQNAIEAIILFVRDDIVKPCMGSRTRRFLPYMLTLFFFVLVGNLMGLLPGAANLTGNISVTLTLAVFTFILTNIHGNRHYWQHVFFMPGVPVFVKPLMTLVEFISLFTKPISLMVRLFVAITAGHIVILCLLGLVFIFHSYIIGIFSTFIVLFVNLIELLVSIVQAYVFTMFSSLYIGLATEDSSEHGV